MKIKAGTDKETKGVAVDTPHLIMDRLRVIGMALVLLGLTPFVFLIGGVSALIYELPGEFKELRDEWNRKPINDEPLKVA